MNKPRREYYEFKTQFMNLDTPLGFILSDNVGPQWVSLDMMELVSNAGHALSIDSQLVGCEYGE